MIPPLRQGAGPRYQQIYEYYKTSILNQQLRSGAKLPSYRWLAKELGVSNNTVLQAYDLLTAEGYLKNEPRKGLYVNTIEVKKWQRAQPAAPQKAAKPSRKLPFSASVHLVDQVNFPIRQWRKCSNLALDNVSYQYEEHERDETLKEELLKYLYKYRGVTATPDQLIIGSGTSNLLFWLAFVLQKRCSEILFEDPGYTRVRKLFEALSYRIRPVKVGPNGINIETLKGERADLLYLTPSHQYPTGVAMPVNHRLQVLDWAKSNGAFIIEDDFDCEFRYRSKLMPSLQALDASGSVIYAGTFSSTLMPSLRVAYMILPLPLLQTVRPFRYLTNTVPYIVRKTLALFMEKGYWESNLRRMNKIYRLKYETCIQALRKLPQDKLLYNNTPSGLNIFLSLKTKLSEAEIVRRAAEQGILITPASQFYFARPKGKVNAEILFEFGSIPASEIEAIINKLYSAWFR